MRVFVLGVTSRSHKMLFSFVIASLVHLSKYRGASRQTDCCGWHCLSHSEVTQANKLYLFVAVDCGTAQIFSNSKSYYSCIIICVSEDNWSWEANSSSASREFPAFYVTRRFITVFKRALVLSLSWASIIQSKLSHPISWRSILVFSSDVQDLKIASFFH